MFLCLLVALAKIWIEKQSQFEVLFVDSRAHCTMSSFKKNFQM